jgi:hypothetical protein
MYANLKVTTVDGDEFSAWKVDVSPTGVVTIHLDENDGQSYAVEGGEVNILKMCTIEADS